MSEDFIVGYTLFRSGGFRTRYQHFDKLEVAKMFASNVNLKDNSKIYVSLKLYEKQQKEIEHLKKEKELDYISKEKIREIMKHYRKLYKEDNSPNQFLMEQTYLSKISLLYDLLEE